MRAKYARFAVKLRPKDLRKITGLLAKGKASVGVIKRALVLRLLSKGYSPPEAADAIGISSQTARKIGWNYIEGGLTRALYDKPRKGKKRALNEKQSNEIIALLCSDPPEGFSRWTMALITEETIKRGIIPAIGKETIRLLMKNHNLKPWRLKMWCIPKLDKEYIDRMEDVLDLYEKPYNPKEPVVCLDEKSIQLLKSAREDVAAKKDGQITKRDSEYIRCGTANAFCGIEPKAGKHFTIVTRRRKRPDFAKVLNKISKRYPKAKTINLVMDNLNTHNEKSLVTYYGKKEGHEIWRRFTIHYTPKHGSWLNQAEIEIG
ncbi:MAG: transposase, partial [Ignavibacteria bacterium]